MLNSLSDYARNTSTSPTNYPVQLFNDTPWAKDALCTELDLYEVDEIFFVDKGGSAKKAKNFCRDCPVQHDCSQYAITHPELRGTWGGTTDRERTQLRAMLGLAEVTHEEIFVEVTTTVELVIFDNSTPSNIMGQ